MPANQPRAVLPEAPYAPRDRYCRLPSPLGNSRSLATALTYKNPEPGQPLSGGAKHQYRTTPVKTGRRFRIAAH